MVGLSDEKVRIFLYRPEDNNSFKLLSNLCTSLTSAICSLHFINHDDKLIAGHQNRMIQIWKLAVNKKYECVMSGKKVHEGQIASFIQSKDDVYMVTASI